MNRSIWCKLRKAGRFMRHGRKRQLLDKTMEAILVAAEGAMKLRLDHTFTLCEVANALNI